MNTYSEIVQQTEWIGGTLRATIPAAWAQGRTVFGGLSAGLALNAMQKNVEADRPLRSVLTSFVGPVRPGNIEIASRSLRQGRNVTHLESTVLQEGAVCCTVLGCYGRKRESSITIAPPIAPEVPAPDEMSGPPFVPGISPEFTRFIEYRWSAESMPYLGQGNGTTKGWIRLREGGEMTPDLFVLLADAWPSPALAMQRGPAPISSLTWNLEIVDLNPTHRADQWWRVQAVIEAAGDGYVYEDALLWAPDGTFAARSRQTVSVYSRGSSSDSGGGL